MNTQSREVKEMAESTYNSGIYCRLNNDGERDGESKQRYIREQGWNELCWGKIA